MTNVFTDLRARVQVPLQYLKTSMMRLAIPTLLASAGAAWAQFGNNGAPVYPTSLRTLTLVLMLASSQM